MAVRKNPNLSINLISDVIYQESKGNPNAISSKGNVGLMQLGSQVTHDFGIDNAYDIHENIQTGSKYLSNLLYKYHNDLSLTLAAYNFGPANVDKGVQYPKETRDYVKNIENVLSRQGGR